VSRTPRVLAISSGGGHWTQLLRLREAWDGCHVTYAATQAGFQSVVEEDAARRGQPKPGFATFTDANRWQKAKLLKALCQIAWIVAKTRPTTVITTGAAPGYFAIRLGKLIGAKTVWLDSFANAEELSMGGTKAGPHATLWLTQWQSIAREDGPDYKGSVL
jgi:UDP-N-acetylglucosamine:LPS N-acetylglucosamine transferase